MWIVAAYVLLDSFDTICCIALNKRVSFSGLALIELRYSTLGRLFF